MQKHPRAAASCVASLGVAALTLTLRRLQFKQALDTCFFPTILCPLRSRSVCFSGAARVRGQRLYQGSKSHANGESALTHAEGMVGLKGVELRGSRDICATGSTVVIAPSKAQLGRRARPIEVSDKTDIARGIELKLVKRGHAWGGMDGLDSLLQAKGSCQKAIPSCIRGLERALRVLALVTPRATEAGQAHTTTGATMPSQGLLGLARARVVQFPRR